MIDEAPDGTPVPAAADPTDLAARRAELVTWLRDHKRAERDRKLRQGRAKPRTLRETELFHQGVNDLLRRGTPDDPRHRRRRKPDPGKPDEPTDTTP